MRWPWPASTSSGTAWPTASAWQGDGLHAVAGQTFDLILCNPPYVNAEAMAALPPGIPRRTPARPVRQCRRRTRRHGLHPPAAARPRRAQNPGAVLVLEIGHERDFFEAAFHLDVVWLPTSAGDDQVLLVTMR
jgi:ribosomal protein L3 glutamine methyltransferase